MLRYHL